MRVFAIPVAQLFCTWVPSKFRHRRNFGHRPEANFTILGRSPRAPKTVHWTVLGRTPRAPKTIQEMTLRFASKTKPDRSGMVSE